MPSTTLAVAAVESTTASAAVGWTHVALLCLVSALAVALLLLGLYMWHLRRMRPDTGAPAARPDRRTPPASMTAIRRSASTSATPAAAPRRPAAAPGTAGALAVAPSAPGPVGCPSCRREYPAGVRFCVYDSRRLVPAGEILERSRAGGSVCARCRRSYDAGIRYCPHDAEELIPSALWQATHGRRVDPTPTGVMAKICPQCAGRYDLATAFCGKDGAELMTIN